MRRGWLCPFPFGDSRQPCAQARSVFTSGVQDRGDVCDNSRNKAILVTTEEEVVVEEVVVTAVRSRLQAQASAIAAIQAAAAAATCAAALSNAQFAQNTKDCDELVARPKFKFPTSPTVIAYQERMEKWKKENEEKKEEKK